MAFDYSDCMETPTGSALAEISRLAGELAKRKAHLAKLEDEVKKAEEAVRDIEERELPARMLEAGMREFTTVSGFRLKLQKSYHATPPVACREQAYDWLEQNGAAAIVKRQFKVPFGKGDDRWAAEFQKLLDEQGVTYERKREVHHQTLKAYVKEAMESGKDLPQDLFGVHVRDTVSIKVGK